MAKDDLAKVDKKYTHKKFSCWVLPELHKAFKKIAIENDVTHEQLTEWLFEKLAKGEIKLDDTIHQDRF